jgi:predicted RNA-binding Zn-ribbon protein involved in translation (DUF1610 family)
MTQVCAECGEAFASADQSDYHRRRAHDPGSQSARRSLATFEPGGHWVCPLCGERLLSPESLQSHSLRPHYRTNRTIERTPEYATA